MKWQFQPGWRTRSWRLSVAEQRREVARHLRQNPSLRPKLGKMMTDIFEVSRLRALRQTGLPDHAIPEGVLYTEEQLLSDWLPE